MLSKFEVIELPDSLKKSVELSSELADGIRPTIEQLEHLNEITRPLKDVSEQYQDIVSRITVPSSGYEHLVNLQNNITEMQLKTSSIAIDTISDSLKSAASSLVPLYAEIQTAKLIESVGNSFSSSLAMSVQNIIPNFSFVFLETIQSPFLDWIKSFDFSPWTHIFENWHFPDFEDHTDELNEIYLRAMYDAKWFPYAGWQAEANLFTEVSDILNTSRGMSKRCEKRIDKAILSYYTKSEIKRIKKDWNASELDSYVKKALGQTLEAYLRGEYALVIPFLATIWEGIIKSKTAEVTKKPKEDFKKLVDENGFDDVFSDFYNNLIIATCYSKEEVIEGVPNRHGVAHSWYVKYPTKKAALNAILLTDFIIKLKPTHKNEKITTQSQEDNSNG